MGARLVSTVYVNDQSGLPAAFGPDDDVPEWAARQMGAHCFEGGKHPFPDDADGDGVADRKSGEEPPRSGRGSGRDAWAQFASEKGQQVPDDAGRDEIIAALVQAGVVND